MEYLHLRIRYGLHLGPSFILIDANCNAQEAVQSRLFTVSCQEDPRLGSRLLVQQRVTVLGSCRGWAVSVTFLCLTY